MRRSDATNRDYDALVSNGDGSAMPDAAQLRHLAAQLFAVAVTTRDKKLAEHLTLRASDCLDQAAELERANASIMQQPQPDDPEKV